MSDCTAKYDYGRIASCDLTKHSENLRGEIVHSASSGGIRLTWHEGEIHSFHE